MSTPTHQLHRKWYTSIFGLQNAGRNTTTGQKSEEVYKAGIVDINEFDTVEGFWSFMHALPQLSSILPAKGGPNIQCFQHGISPTWEDPQHAQGCRLRVEILANEIDSAWNEVIMALVGEQFGDLGDHITGVVCSLKYSKRIDLWMNTDHKETVRTIATKLKTLLNKQKCTFDGFDESLPPSEKRYDL
ncbi:hypothetical protein P9112_008166 [Eukaryota sp. TZLM1-RC]